MAAASGPADTASVTLRLERGSETISGTLQDERGVERRFWGWLELSAALDETRGVESGSTSSGRLEGGV
jgi:hypothetical protein